MTAGFENVDHVVAHQGYCQGHYTVALEEDNKNCCFCRVAVAVVVAVVVVVVCRSMGAALEHSTMQLLQIQIQINQGGSNVYYSVYLDLRMELFEKGEVAFPLQCKGLFVLEV